MWEGLARTRRQDRVLHGAAKALNIVVGLIALPLWLIGQAIGGPIRDLLVRLERRQARALPVPPSKPRTMEALTSELDGLKHHLRPNPVAELRRGLADVSPFVLSQTREGAVLGYQYPSQFSQHIFEGADGERISATIGLQPEAGRPSAAPAGRPRTSRPGLIVVHGLFSSSRFDYVRQIAVRAYYDWGFNVAALDLRSFGLTELTTHAPSTAGWKEGEDIVALGRYMKGLGATSVGTLGISLGGGAVVNACNRDGAETALDGGILAVSPPADPLKAWSRLSEPVPPGHPRYPLHKAFHAMLVSRVRSGRWPAEAEEADSMAAVLELLAEPYYKLPAAEIWRHARGVDRIADAKVPVLILHPEDDVIVKVEHARMLAEAATGNDLVKVWILPAGAHGILEAIDSTFTYNVYRLFFERWARYAERGERPGGFDAGPRPQARPVGI
ncbi:MAG: alpha/beta hydrolase family protein [Solirubrobacterales bacterium]